MQRVQLTLKQEVYRNPDKLEVAISQVRAIGRFATLDSRYAAKIGVLSGELPDDCVRAVESLEVVSAVQRNVPMRALVRA